MVALPRVLLRFKELNQALSSSPLLRLKLISGLGAIFLIGGFSTTFRSVDRSTVRIYWLGTATAVGLTALTAREAQRNAEQREADLNRLWLEQDEQRLAELAAYRAELETSLAAKAEAVATAAATQIKAAEAEATRLQAQIAQLQTQTATEKQQFQAEKQSLLDALTGEKERAKREIARAQRDLSFVTQDYDAKQQAAQMALDQARSELEQLQFSLQNQQAEIEARRTELIQKRDEANAQLKERLAIIKQRESTLDQTNAEFEAKWLHLLSEKDAQISELQQRLAALQMPSRPAIRNNAEAIADNLIELLYSKDVLVDFNAAYEVNQVVYVRLNLRPQFGLNDLKSCADAIERTLQTSTPPEFRNVGGCVEVVLSFEKLKERGGIVEPEENWLETALLQPKDEKLRPNHARFVGESESGKSALVNNCLGIIKRHLPDLRVQLGDPLYYSGESNWDFEPTYKDADQCIEGLEAAANLVQERIDQPDLPRYPLLYLQDEIDDLVAQFGERALAAIRKVWKQGRHVGVWLWVLGQSPYAKTLKMGIFDVKNAVNFFLGSTIPKGLGEFIPDSAKKDYWLKQFQTRLDAGQEYVSAVFPKRRPGFLAELPPPGTHADRGLLESLVSTASELPLNSTSTASQPHSTTAQLPLTATEESGLNQFEPQILALLAQNKRPHEIVFELWGLRPSRSKNYKSKLNFVESLVDN